MARTAQPKPDDQITVTLTRRQILALEAVYDLGIRQNEAFHHIGNTSTAESAMSAIRRAAAE